MRFNNIQIVRFFTAIGVVAAHTGYYGEYLFGSKGMLCDILWSSHWIGYLAPLFFAISGFVLTQALYGSPPGRFLFARALRVYPGYWVSALLVMAAMGFTVWPPEFRRYVRFDTVSWSLLPHGPAACVYPLGVEWTLVYEMVLYLWMTAVAVAFGVRRGLPIAAGAWLAVLAVKASLWPELGSPILPTWKNIWFSTANVGFLLGVLAYYLRSRGHQWRWHVLVLLAGYVAIVSGRFQPQESQWAAYGVAAAVAIWLVVQFPQVTTASPLVKAGEYTYGLYLLHVPLIMGVYYLLLSRDWMVGTTTGVLLAGAIALVAGMLYGWLELRLYAKLRPIAKWRFHGLSAGPRWLAKLTGRTAKN